VARCGIILSPISNTISYRVLLSCLPSLIAPAAGAIVVARRFHWRSALQGLFMPGNYLIGFYRQQQSCALRRSRFAGRAAAMGCRSFTSGAGFSPAGCAVVRHLRADRQRATYAAACSVCNAGVEDLHLFNASLRKYLNTKGKITGPAIA